MGYIISCFLLIFFILLSAGYCLLLKKYPKNSTYIIVNLLYIIPGILSALTYLNNFVYHIYNSHDIPGILGIIFAIIFGIPFLIFYIMGITFTILLHPLVQIIIFYFAWKKKHISRIYIIIAFVFSTAIAFVHLYLIYGKNLILSA